MCEMSSDFRYFPISLACVTPFGVSGTPVALPDNTREVLFCACPCRKNIIKPIDFLKFQIKIIITLPACD